MISPEPDIHDRSPTESFITLPHAGIARMVVFSRCCSIPRVWKTLTKPQSTGPNCRRGPNSGPLLVATSISVESNHSEINNNDESSLSDLHKALVGYVGDALADHPAASVVQCRVSLCYNLRRPISPVWAKIILTLKLL